jgi:pyruvate/2-oxoglutarate dehydrogenase complex dihydrolipoamide dehydrogenase (E3) component
MTGYPGQRFDEAWRRLVLPPDYRQPEPRDRYHLVVIGAGPAGLVTAIAAAGLGAKVALVERAAMGGDCLNAGCVPSKSLLEFTRDARSADHFDAAFAWLREVRATIAEHDSVQRYTDAGVDVFLGSAKFIDSESILVDHTRLVTRRAVIATGSRPVLPPIEGLAESRPLTNETLFDLKERPRRLGIIGGGPIGCEIAQAFARLGVDVSLLESASRLLPKESPQASAVVGRVLRDCGVRVELDAPVTGVSRRGQVVAVTLGNARGEILVDELLVAAGRRANTNELNLAAVGVETDSDGRIVVDRYLRTTNQRIYAAGDVCSVLQLTHNADAHARIVVQNALFLPSARADKLIVPRCTYTDPEVAQIGRLATELDDDGTPFDAYRTAFAELDRGKTQNDDDGFVEVLTASGKDDILGATIVGRDAGEQIACLAIAMHHGLGLGALGKAVLPYPTRAEFVRKLADQYNRKRLTPTTQRLIRAWLRSRG